MWQPYLKVITERTEDAVHIPDRFHIMRKMNEAMDQIRCEEVCPLKADGYEPIRKHSRWTLLKNAANRTLKQTVKLRKLLQYNLRSVRSHLKRENFSGSGNTAPSAGRRNSSTNGARTRCVYVWNR